MMILQHQKTFFHFLGSLESILQIYGENGNDEYFTKTREVQLTACKQQSKVALLLGNGYYVTQAGIAPGHVQLEASEYEEYLHFHQASTPIIDENELIPKKVRLIKRLFGQMARLETFSRDNFASNSISNYAELQNAFMNIDDSNRSEIIFSSFQAGLEGMKSYLRFRGLLDPNIEVRERIKAEEAKGVVITEMEKLRREIPFKRSRDFEADVLQAKVEFLGFKIECSATQRVLMSWILGGTLP